MRNEAKIVLVVEDEPLIRMDIVGALEDAGFHVLEAGNVGQALTVLAMHQRIAAVFTDIDMPGELNGLDLAAKVRSRDRTIPIVIASGRAVRSQELPLHGRFFAKPYRSEEVVETLNAMLAAA